MTYYSSGYRHQGAEAQNQCFSTNSATVPSQQYNSPAASHTLNSLISPFQSSSGSLHNISGPIPQLAEMSSKIEQLLAITTNNQQTLIQQQTTIQQLQHQVQQLSQELNEVKATNHDHRASTVDKPERVKVKIPKALSAVVKKLYIELEADKQFNPSDPYGSHQNQIVADFLVTQIKTEHGDQFSVEHIKRAVYRYFESRKRLHNDSQPHRLEKVKRNKRNAQRKVFQKRLYERRKKHVKRDQEMRLWREINEHYMTEETESEGGENIRRHKLPWRSQVLNTLVERLDRRAEKTHAESLARTPLQAKSRIDSALSTLSIPLNPPSWAVDDSYHEKISTAPVNMEGAGERSQAVTPSAGGAASNSSHPSRRLSLSNVLQDIEETSSAESDNIQ